MNELDLLEEEFEEEDAGEQQDISRVPKQLQPHVFKKGQSGNPSGRPAGRSLKEYAKEMLNKMTEEERQEFLQGIDKRIIWEMAEGKAEAKTEVAGDLTITWGNE